MRRHPSPANSHQSGPMLEPQREEAIAHSTGAHSPSTRGGEEGGRGGRTRPFNPSRPGPLHCYCAGLSMCVCVSDTVLMGVTRFLLFGSVGCSTHNTNTVDVYTPHPPLHPPRPPHTPVSPLLLYIYIQEHLSCLPPSSWTYGAKPA